MVTIIITAIAIAILFIALLVGRWIRGPRFYAEIKTVNFPYRPSPRSILIDEAGAAWEVLFSLPSPDGTFETRLGRIE